MMTQRQPHEVKLTPREEQIVHSIWAGHSNNETAVHLKISVKTVEAHRANLMKKLRVANAAGVLRACIEMDIIKLGHPVA